MERELNKNFNLPLLKIKKQSELKILKELGFSLNANSTIDLFEIRFIVENKYRFEKNKLLNIESYQKFMIKNQQFFSDIKNEIYYQLYSLLRKNGYLSIFCKTHLLVMRKGRHINDDAFAYIIKYFDSDEQINLRSFSELVNYGKQLRKEVIIATNDNKKFVFYSLKNTAFE